MLQNSRLIRALLRQSVDHTPVWLMRQAGRYLPEYRELRSKVPNFMTFCKTPELTCKATLQPLERFDLDAAIIFSDILTIPVAMGIDLEISPEVGPVIHNPIRSAHDLKKLMMPEIRESLSYVMEAVSLVRKELNNKVPLIGFAGSPWTLACYMVEGHGSKTFNSVRSMLYCEPKMMHALLTKLTALTLDYLNAQIAAGAQAIMLFDTWGGLLTPNAYKQFSLHYMSRIAQGVCREFEGNQIPLIFFTKNSGQWLEAIADSGCDAVSLDWTVDIGDARTRIGDRVALQGNLDPAVLFSKPSEIRVAVKEIMQVYDGHPGHVFNLGHGIDKATPPDNVAVMIEAVHEFCL